MIRDTRKNQEYFIRYLDYQYSRIEQKVSKLHECGDNEEKKQRILLSLTKYEIDLLKAEFSSGAPIEKLRALLARAIGFIKEYKKPTKEDILILLSLAIMLDIESYARILTVVNEDMISKDRLLQCLSAYIKLGTWDWDESIALDSEYDKLNNVFEGSDKEEALLDYLESWYHNHRGYAWYDSHLGDKDTYCGYWSFESAAIVRMLSLDDRKLRENKFYPYLQ